MTDTGAASRKGPLADLRMIEMGQLLAGPYCGQLMADFGAEVIKVEPPGAGDPMRVWGRSKSDDAFLWWPILARNKKSVTVNAREAEGQDIIRELVRNADFLLENFRPGTMEKWGLGYDDLKKINPGLIMIRVSGFGQTGPRAKDPGYASIGEAMGGLRYVIGEPDRVPARAGISLGDSLAATFACVGALMALHHRHNTGEGQVVDSAIYEACFAYMESLITEYWKNGYQRERTGPILPKVAPSNIYPTSDDQMILIAGNQDTVFRRLCAAMGRPEMGEDPRYATHVARGEVQEELDDLIAQWTRTKTADEVEALMREHSVPHGKLFTAKDILEDEHYRSREMIIDIVDKKLGLLKMQNVVPKLSGTPGEIRATGPALGEHNEEVFKGVLGWDDGKFSDYLNRGII